jgi:uncharacterized protein (DUF433 family)
VIRVGGTRVALESIVIVFDRGASAEEIVDSYPALELTAAYATLAYVLAHRVEVDEYVAGRRRAGDAVKAEMALAGDRFRARSGLRSPLRA